MTAITRVALGALLSAACTAPDEPSVESSDHAVAVTWTNLVGVAASGNDLTKTGATGWNAGASSVETLAGDGFVEFTTAENNTNKMAGLGNGDPSPHYADIEFAIQLKANGTVGVYESGALRGSFGAYAAGDRFRVEVVAGEVFYQKNGVTFHSSTIPASFPLLVDTSLYTPGATVNDVELVSTGLDWQNAVGVAVSGRNLTKTITGSWNAGASSVQTLTGDGFLEFTTGENTTGKMIGLSSDDASLHYSDIDFAFYLKANGTFTVYETGIARATSMGAYIAGDTFRIAVSGGVVTYSVNGGVPLYTSALAPAASLRVDASFLTVGGTVRDVTLTEAGRACLAYDGSGLVCSGSFVVNNSFDLEEIANCANITGDLTVDAPGLAEIGLPALERIGGDLTIVGNSGLDRVRFPALKRMVGSVLVSGPAPDHVDLSRLISVNTIQLVNVTGIELGCLQSARNFFASDVAIPRLRTVTRSLTGNVTAPALESVGNDLSGQLIAPVLETVGGDATAHPLVAPSLTAVGGRLDYWADSDVPALESAGAIDLKDPESIDLPALIEVTGTFRGGVSPCAPNALSPIPSATVLALPALERVGALILCTHGPYTPATWPLTDVSLPLLREVTGPVAVTQLFQRSLWIGDTGALSQVDLPSLETVVGHVEIRFPLDVPLLNSMDGNFFVAAATNAPSLLEVVGRLTVGGPLSADSLVTIHEILDATSSSLSSISLPALASAGGLRILAANLTSLELPSLASVAPTPVGGNGSVVVRATNVALLAMPSLSAIANELLIIDNDFLTDIDFPVLTALGPLLRISQNPLLPTCQAIALRDQLIAAGWTGTASIGGNGSGPCP